MKKIYITNAVGTSGKDTFAEMINRYVPTHKYTIATLGYRAAEVFGYNRSTKTEEDRLFISNLLDLGSQYNDSPFRDVTSIVADFKNNLIEDEVLIIDMRDPKDISRAVETFGAKTILIRNPRVKKIESNHADRDVENYNYDYIIENDGTLEQLDIVAHLFVKDAIYGNKYLGVQKPIVFTTSKY